jgi:hypothetical protein
MPRVALNRLALLAATTAAVGAVAVSAASAAVLAPSTISEPGQSASYPQVAGNAAGDAAVAWTAYNVGLLASTRPAGGPWESSPTQLNTPGTTVPTRQIAVDATGAATAIWTEYTPVLFMGMPQPGPVSVHTARRPAGAAWGASEQLSTPAVDAGYVSVLATGADGTVVALWSENSALMSSTRSRTGAWSAPLTVPDSPTAQTPQLAVDADGIATAAWQDANNNHTMAATLPAGGTWTAPTDVSNGIGFEPAMAMNRDGDATLVWNNGNYNQVSARRPSSGGTWSAPHQISVTGAVNSYMPLVAVDASGRATAVWSQADFAGGAVSYHQMAASRAADGTWAAPVSLGNGGSDPLSVAASDDGDVTVVWRGLDAQSHYLVRTASHAPGGAWSQVTDLTDFGTAAGPVVTVDDQGDALFVAAPGARVVAEADDNAGPRLREVLIPATATAGQPANFGVSPLDVWSDLGTTTWDFGDGTTATGRTPTHTFTSAGTKTVTITSTDALDHRTTMTGTIIVADAPTPPAPTVEPPAAADPAPAAPAAVDTTPRTGCVSRRVITLHFSLPAGHRARSVALRVTGRAERRLHRTTRKVTIDLRGVKLRTVTVTVLARTTNGHLVTDTRRYRTCGR